MKVTGGYFSDLDRYGLLYGMAYLPIWESGAGFYDTFCR